MKKLALALALVLAAPLHAAPRNFMWKATKGQGVLYLVGSVHMLTKDYYPLSAELESAFKGSDLVVEEVDLAEMLSPVSQFALLQRGMLPSSTSLEKSLTPATYALLSTRVTAAGMPMEALQRLKPWMIALTLEALEWQKAGLDPDLGLDKHFFDRAHVDGKLVQGLETAEYQISRFDEMTMAQQDRMLAETLKDLETETADVTKLANAWKAGDAPTVERIVLADLKSDPVMYQRLLVERNRNWLPKVEALFNRRGSAFVIVGAAHIVGPDGLVAMLRARGYTVEQQ
jgi:uncharacterized protein YbaP (TraB family)